LYTASLSFIAMDILKSLVGNLAVVRYLVLNGRKYRPCDLERLLHTIDECLEKPENLSIEEIQAFQHSVADCINSLEALREQDAKSQAQIQEIDALIERLNQIIDRCRRLQEVEQLVLRIMLTVKLYG
jgi:DNA-binding transcriptional MerR regulator